MSVIVKNDKASLMRNKKFRRYLKAFAEIVITLLSIMRQAKIFRFYFFWGATSVMRDRIKEFVNAINSHNTVTHSCIDDFIILLC